MIEYVIVRSDAAGDLSDLVNDKLKKGWELYGGLVSTVRRESDGESYVDLYQAMTKTKITP